MHLRRESGRSLQEDFGANNITCDGLLDAEIGNLIKTRKIIQREGERERKWFELKLLKCYRMFHLRTNFNYILQFRDEPLISTLIDPRPSRDRPGGGRREDEYRN